MIAYAKPGAEQYDFIDVAAAEDIPNGGRLFLEIDNLFLVVFNIAGALFAIADMCSHDEGPLGEGELEGYEVRCPRHGARFDVRTGEATRLPAVINIPAYPVRVVEGRVEVGIPI